MVSGPLPVGRSVLLPQALPSCTPLPPPQTLECPNPVSVGTWASPLSFSVGWAAWAASSQVGMLCTSWLHGLKDLVRAVLTCWSPSDILIGIYRKEPVLSAYSLLHFCKVNRSAFVAPRLTNRSSPAPWKPLFPVVLSSHPSPGVISMGTGAGVCTLYKWNHIAGSLVSVLFDGTGRV